MRSTRSVGCSQQLRLCIPKLGFPRGRRAKRAFREYLLNKISTSFAALNDANGYTSGERRQATRPMTRATSEGSLNISASQTFTPVRKKTSRVPYLYDPSPDNEINFLGHPGNTMSGMRRYRDKHLEFSCPENCGMKFTSHKTFMDHVLRQHNNR